MKVICVNHDIEPGEFPYGPSDPQIGDECEVIREVTFSNCFGMPLPCLDLIGYEHLYNQKNFAIVSSIDETELVNEKELAL